MDANARTKAAAAAAAPFVQRVISDDELRDNVRVALESARQAFSRLQDGKTTAKTALDDKQFQGHVSSAASALKSAADGLRSGAKPAPAPARRSGGVGRKLFVLAFAAIVAIAVSEGLRDKVLDALFGKEEEFDYSSTTAPATPAPTNAS